MLKRNDLDDWIIHLPNQSAKDKLLLILQRNFLLKLANYKSEAHSHAQTPFSSSIPKSKSEKTALCTLINTIFHLTSATVIMKTRVGGKGGFVSSNLTMKAASWISLQLWALNKPELKNFRKERGWTHLCIRVSFWQGGQRSDPGSNAPNHYLRQPCRSPFFQIQLQSL